MLTRIKIAEIGAGPRMYGTCHAYLKWLRYCFGAPYNWRGFGHHSTLVCCVVQLLYPTEFLVCASSFRQVHEPRPKSHSTGTVLPCFPACPTCPAKNSAASARQSNFPLGKNQNRSSSGRNHNGRNKGVRSKEQGTICPFLSTSVSKTPYYSFISKTFLSR